MPISAANKKKYPSDWKEISQHIRDRDHNECKFCHAPNGEYIMRSKCDPFRWCMDDPATSGCLVWGGTAFELYKWSEAPDEYIVERMIKIVLTVAHLNHDPSDNRDENLASLCQRCHLVYDKKEHNQHSKETRQRKKQEQEQSLGQAILFPLKDE